MGENVLEVLQILENLTSMHGAGYCGKVYYCNDEPYTMIEVPAESINRAISLLEETVKTWVKTGKMTREWRIKARKLLGMME